MYNLSGIQKGIQAGHAGQFYARLAELNSYGEEGKAKYNDFIDNHKTFIVLDGGTSSTMIEREKELEEFGIPFASFVEPDLNNSISAIAFIIDESIYDFDESKLPQNGLMYFPEQFLSEEDQRKYKIYKYLKSFRLAAN
jgi:hypothetical protein